MKKNRKGAGLFQLIDRKIFDQLVDKWGMDNWVRSLTTWEMTCALVSAMTLRLESYREVEETLGIPRSTFSDAMANRYSGFFVELCDQILLQIRARTRDRKMKKAIRQILAMDSTEIRVHGSLFSNPRWQSRNPKAESLATAKFHCVWNVDGEWIDDFLITGARANDSPVGLLFKLKPHCIYVFDRAYNDADFWVKIVDSRSHFVTRLKTQGIARLKEAKLAEKKKKDGVLYDGIYKPCLTALKDLPKERRLSIKFRVIVYRDAVTKKIFYFITSDWRLCAKTIAGIYKRRWAVELLFRWLKGHLNIRYLAAKNKNAIKIQLATAVLLQLLLQLKKIADHYRGTLWELLRTIRTMMIRQSLILHGPPADCRWKVPIRRHLREVYL